MVSAVEFNNWLKRSRQGGMCIYHTGFLAVDRFYRIFDPSKGDSAPLLIGNDIHATATSAMNAWEAGKVHLFQRKLHDGVYQYIAMKASRRNW